MFDKLRETYHYSRYKKVKKIIGNSKNLLDIGCGRPCESMEDGSLIKFIGYGTGMDIKKCSGFKFKKGSILKIPFPEKTFDVVVCMEVLEHVDNINLALENVYRVLKDDGIFVMSTPNNGLLWRMIWFFWEKSVGKLWHEKHVTNLTKKEWIGLLSKYFNILSIRSHWYVLLIVKMEKKKN